MADQRPVIEPFTPRLLGDKPWGEELLIAETATYIGKRLTMRAASWGAFQRHLQKDETFFLHSGLAVVNSINADGQTVTELLREGQAVHVPPGAWHQVIAVTDCVIFEASTPHFDDRERLTL